jgi:hypothetical protein
MLNMGNIQHVLILMGAKFIEASIDIEPYHSINVVYYSMYVQWRNFCKHY